MATSPLECVSRDLALVHLPTRYPVQAAKFGRSFLDLHNPSDFVNMGQALKVLNAVRVWDIGIPISYSQWVLGQPRQYRSHSSQVQLHLFTASCEPPDVTEPTSVGTPDIYISFSETGCCPEALGMCQDHKVETKHNRYGKRRRTTWGRRSLSIDRREILQTRRWFGQLRRHRKESMGGRKTGSSNQGTQAPVFPVPRFSDRNWVSVVARPRTARV